MNRIILLSTIIALFGCSTFPDEKAKNIRIIDAHESKGCEFQSIVGAFDTFSATVQAERDSVIVKMKKKAIKINANAIFIENLSSNVGGSSGQAKAYKCPDPFTLLAEYPSFTKEKLKLLKQNAKSGDPESQYLYGAAIFRKNNTEGLFWIKMSARQDYVKAQGFLGLQYYYGVYIEKNYFKAFKWFKRAAENGDGNIQGLLGISYLHGEGAPTNEIQAYVWMSMSSTQGNTLIKSTLKRLKATMSKQQIIIAQDLASKCWESKFKDCD